jgi:uncharacterized protein YjbI with pentapeptide repeats
MEYQGIDLLSTLLYTKSKLQSYWERLMMERDVHWHRNRKRIPISNSNIIRIIVAVIFLAMGVSAVWFISTDFWLGGQWKGYVINESQFGYFLLAALVSFGPNLAAIVIGVIIIDYLSEQRQTEQLKRQLIRQIASPHNEVANTAVIELAYHGWLFDGSMKKADLFRANLEKADLSNADLDGSEIISANLKNAVLVQANLSNTNMLNVKLNPSKLSLAKFNRAFLKTVNLEGADVSRADFRRATLEAVILDKADMSNVNMEGSIWLFVSAKGTGFYGANLPSIDFSSSSLIGAFFDRAVLTNADLHGVNLTDAHLVEADLSRADLQNAILENADLELADLSGANLRNAKVTIEQLHHVTITHETIMPDGSLFNPSDYPDWRWRNHGQNQ